MVEDDLYQNGVAAQIEAGRRNQLLARLAAERSYFLRQFWGLDEATLSSNPVSGVGDIVWTAKDLLAHMGRWDAFQAERISRLLGGRRHDIHRLDEASLNAHNVEWYTQYRALSLEAALAVCLKERAGFLALLERVPDEELYRRRRLAAGWRTSIHSWVRRRYEHDAVHAQDLAAWRKQLPEAVRRQRLGPRFLLRAILKATRKEFLTTAALVPADKRETQPVCGVWSLKDLLGHLTDWELLGVEGLRQLANGQTPEFEQRIDSFDTFNNANAAARHDQPWDQIWQAFTETRQTLLALLDSLPDEALARPFVTPWGPTLNGYVWTSIWSSHEHEHGIDVRRALRLRGWPKRLQQ